MAYYWLLSLRNKWFSGRREILLDFVFERRKQLLGANLFFEPSIDLNNASLNYCKIAKVEANLCWAAYKRGPLAIYGKQ